MAKDLKTGMGRGLCSLMQPTTPQTEEPKAEPEALPTAPATDGPAEEPQQGETPAEPIQKRPQPFIKVQRARKKPKKEVPSSLTEGLRDGYTRATIIVNMDTIAKIREIAYLERANVVDVVEQALSELVAKYERIYGEVKPPKK